MFTAQSLRGDIRPLAATPLGCPCTALAVRRCSRRGSTGPCGMGRLARRIVVTATVPRDAQPEWLEFFFRAQAERIVRALCPWINLPPLAIFAQPPVGCGHCRPLSRRACLKTTRAAGARPHAAVRVASLPAPLPFDLESSPVTIYKQDPCLRRLLPALTVG
jgi:hypothetical protein